MARGDLQCYPVVKIYLIIHLMWELLPILVQKHNSFQFSIFNWTAIEWNYEFGLRLATILTLRILLRIFGPH